MSAGLGLEASEVCLVSEGASYYEHLSSSVQEMKKLCIAVSNLKSNYLPANPIHVAVYLQHVLEVL